MIIASGDADLVVGQICNDGLDVCGTIHKNPFQVLRVATREEYDAQCVAEYGHPDWRADHALAFYEVSVD